MYKTAGFITSVSEYERDMYANALENVSSNTASCEENVFHILGTYMRYPFYVVEFKIRYPQKPCYDQ